MQKAQTIELVMNRDESYFRNGYTLKINNIIISNWINEKLEFGKHCNFQTRVCEFCGEEGCDVGGCLSLRRDQNNLLFIPSFNLMETFEEFNFDTRDGDCECPPHEWYEKGYLLLEEDFIVRFKKVLTGFSINNVPFINEREMNLLFEWEILVKKKPFGFMTAQ